MEKKNSKSCFGLYENGSSSWHCLGCIVANECKRYQEVKRCQDQAKMHTT